MSKKNILFLCCLLLFGCLASYAQDQKSVAPNDIPVPWYSQKISGCPYAHCSLASSLMVFDYYKGMTVDNRRTDVDAEAKLVEYQKNYFLKKRAPFKRRTSVAQGGYLYFEIDSLARYYEQMQSAEFFMKKDYSVLRDYIDKGIPVLINVKYRGSTRGLVPGSHGHWMVLRGIDDTHVWINDPGRSADMRDKAENIRYPIKKESGNPSYFDGCWTGKYIVITPKEWESPLLAQHTESSLPPIDNVTEMQHPVFLRMTPPDIINRQ